jgi:tripartite-type tricarboxylate transporter receptor subunit TctC
MVTLIPHVKAGKLRALAVSSTRRVPLLPDVPTIAEAALPGFETGTWYGIVAPAGTPQPVVARLNREVNRILALPDVQEKLLAQGLEPAGNTPVEFAAMIRSEIAKYAKIVKAAGIKAE